MWRRGSASWAWAWLAVVVAGLAVSTIVAVLLLRANAEHASGERMAHPQLVALTDQPNTTATYSIQYYAWSRTSSGRTEFGPQDDSLPTNTREVTLSFHSPIPQATLNWVLLLNDDARMTDAIAVHANGEVQVTEPGGQLTTTCPDIDGFSTAQVLSGQIALDQQGDGEASVVGGVDPHATYPSQADRTAVDVMSVLPTSPTDQSGKACTTMLIGWDQVNSQLWRPPRVTRGSVTVGQVPGGSFVESANPPVTDPRDLSWVVQGPADISYTLFSTNGQGTHELRLFVAGAAAALAATLLVETFKAALEVAERRSARAEPHDGSVGGAPPMRPPPPRRDKDGSGKRGRVLAVGAVLAILAAAAARRARR
jgi:hypothetical protein